MKFSSISIFFTALVLIHSTAIAGKGPNQRVLFWPGEYCWDRNSVDHYPAGGACHQLLHGYFSRSAGVGGIAASGQWINWSISGGILLLILFSGS